MTPLLELLEFAVTRLRTPVVRGLSFTLEPGEVLTLVGRNGAGKSSLLEGIAGLHATSGELRCGGRPLAGAAIPERLRAGVVLCAEGRSLFPEMSLRENLLLGGYLAPRDAALRRAEELLARFPLLAERSAQKAGSLSGGEQQLLAVCRALMSGPRVLLLDEPTGGLAPLYRGAIAALVREVVAEGERSVILVDDNLDFALDLADRVLALAGGREVFRLTRSDRPSADLILRELLAAERRATPQDEGRTNREEA
ncbi:MAG TPA: ATP-binding cassette domain-containing protein [Thermoanaerobaculia bacterium]|nr:ATP-binding cassette domain-containing protein [Thermoanaerobaculia bacterium]